jgi:hypothetical protein
MRFSGWIGAVALVGCIAWGGGLGAQTATTLVVPPAPLLPQSVQGFERTGEAVAGEDPAQADAAAAEVLREDGLQRFSRARYAQTPVEALQFNDATGAESAFTYYLKNGARILKPDGHGARQVAVMGDRTMLLLQTVVLIVDQNMETNREAARLAGALTGVMPKVSGPRSLAPMLPTLVPSKGLVAGSVRYALGSASYTAMGGTLAGGKLGWEKNAEVVTAQYADRRGKETLTLLLYPTPQIAGEHTRALETETQSGLKVRREGELVAVAVGSFSADDAQNVIENIHLHSVVTFDKDMPVEFHTEVQKTYSLLTNIAVFCVVGTLASVLLGVFLGGGRALIRKMRGKEASTDAEFLSLHLEPQNPRPKFDPPAS